VSLFLENNKFLKVLISFIIVITVSSCSKSFLNPQPKSMDRMGSGGTTLNVIYANDLVTSVSREDCKETVNSNNCLFFKDSDATPLKSFNSGNIAAELKEGPIYFIIPNQNNVISPVNMTYYNDPNAISKTTSTEVRVKLFHKESGRFKEIVLSAQRYIHYESYTELNNIAILHDPEVAYLIVSFDILKNPSLKSGSYEGEFLAQGKSPLSVHADYSKEIKVKVFIDIK
jgi:hypothetical protein